MHTVLADIVTAQGGIPPRLRFHQTVLVLLACGNRGDLSRCDLLHPARPPASARGVTSPLGPQSDRSVLLTTSVTDF